MLKSLSVGAVALAGAGLVAVAPAAAATTPTTAPAGTGYVAVAPGAFHSARVILDVPAVTCSTSGPDRGVELGLFVTVPKGKKLEQVSLTIDATCHAGASRYRAVYRSGNSGSPTKIHAGDRVRLILSGKDANGFEVDDLTTGEADGGGSGSPGPVPSADRHVLIGARVVGAQPHGLQVVFSGAKVDGTALPSVSHHRQGRTANRHVGALHRGDFTLTLAKPAAAG